MRRQGLVVAIVAALGISAAAQQPPAGGANPTKAEGTVLKNRAPVNKELLRVKLPRPKEADLSNGVHLIVLEDRRTPQVNFSMIIDLPLLVGPTTSTWRGRTRPGSRPSNRSSRAIAWLALV